MNINSILSVFHINSTVIPNKASGDFCIEQGGMILAGKYCSNKVAVKAYYYCMVEQTLMLKKTYSIWQFVLV